MLHLPDLSRIERFVRLWRRGILSSEEASQLIADAMDPENYIPANELIDSEEELAFSTASEKAALNRLERKLDQLALHLGAASRGQAGKANSEHSSSELSPAVRQLADDGEKLQAIKVHRQQTGVALKDAKDAVEAYLRRERKPR